MGEESNSQVSPEWPQAFLIDDAQGYQVYFIKKHPMPTGNLKPPAAGREKKHGKANAP